MGSRWVSISFQKKPDPEPPQPRKNDKARALALLDDHARTCCD